MARKRGNPKPIDVHGHEVVLEPFRSGPNGGKVARCQRIFGVKHRKAGQQCSQPAKSPSEFCKSHNGNGGKLVGPLNPNWKGGVSNSTPRVGRWMSKLPEQLRAEYAARYNDPELLSLHDDIALMDVRIADVLTAANSPYIDPAVMIQTLTALGSAMAVKDAAMMQAHFNRAMDLAGTAQTSQKAWNVVGKMTDRRRSLVESEQRRRIQVKMFMGKDQVTRFAASVVEIVTRHVHDRATLAAVWADMQTLMNMLDNEIVEAVKA